MFLFTTPTSTAPSGSAGGTGIRADGDVLDAIRNGSQRTGTDFDYLVATAQRESSLDPAAKAKTSSASGLFQFIEQTWLGMVKGAGAEHGLGQYADAITEVKPGRFDVPDPQTKAQILSLRNDPETAAIMAGAFTRRNGQNLAGLIGRQPTEGELYVAHVMGATGAADLIRATQTRPATAAAELFPDQAAANKAIFYDRASGRPRSAAEVYAALTAQPTQAKLSSDPSTWRVGAAKEEPIAAPAYVEHPDAPALYGLFRTEGPRNPLGQAVRSIWSGLPARAAASGPGFFPRGAGQAPTRTASLGAIVSDAAQPGLLAGTPEAAVPLPPVRPAGLGAQASGAHASGAPASGSPAAAARPRGPGPLNLLAFLKPVVKP